MQYKYRKISLDQFAVLTESEIRPGSDISFNTDIEFGYDAENRMLANKLSVTATSEGVILLKAVISSYFEIKDAEGHLQFNPFILVQFASLNYGSLRGALAIKTADTPLKDIVLPPIYFQSIITSGFSI